MDEQGSSACNNFIPLLNEDKCTLPSFPGQQSNALSRMISREGMDPIQLESPMYLNECMDLVAKKIGISNPMNGCMGLKKSLDNILDDCADQFKAKFIIIPFDGNMFIDFVHRRVFTGTLTDANGQSFYEHCVYILHDCNLKMFTLLCVRRTDSSRKLNFENNDLENIDQDICDFIDKWNCEKPQSSTSTTNNIRNNNGSIVKGANSCERNNNAAQFSSTSTVDKGIFVPASEAIQTSLRSTLQMVTLIGCRLDNIQLEQKPTDALLNNFNRLPDKEKIKAIYDEMIFVTESLRMAMAPDHEEVGENSSVEVERGRYSLDQIKQGQSTFIVLDGNQTSCDLTFPVGLDERTQTDSSFDDVNGISEIKKYIDGFNPLALCPYLTLQGDQMLATDQDVFNDTDTDDFSELATETNIDDADLPTTTTEIHTSNDETTERSIRTNDASATLSITKLPVQIPDMLIDTARSSGSNRIRRNDRISSHPQASSSAHLPNTTQASQTTSTLSPTKTILNSPKIETEPKSECKARCIEELIPNEENRTFVELLQGVGRARTRIKVKVPRKVEGKMYLAVTVRTINNRCHPTKIVLPKGTKVNTKHFNCENRLNYFKFDGCDAKGFFDPNTRIVYLEITPEEHRNGFKEVPVYMFNLYKNRRISKDTIERKQLNKCKLAFWLAVKENKYYRSISRGSLSRVIIEKQKKKK